MSAFEAELDALAADSNRTGGSGGGGVSSRKPRTSDRDRPSDSKAGYSLPDSGSKYLATQHDAQDPEDTEDAPVATNGSGSGRSGGPAAPADGNPEESRKSAAMKKAKSARSLITLDMVERRLMKSDTYMQEAGGCGNGRLVIDPRGPFMRRWDMVMVVCLIFTALVTPYEISFLSGAAIAEMPPDDSSSGSGSGSGSGNGTAVNGTMYNSTMYNSTYVTNNTQVVASWFANSTNSTSGSNSASGSGSGSSSGEELSVDTSSTLFWINQGVNLLFLFDMGVNLFLSYFDENEGQYVFNNTRIVCRYLQSWFFIDLVSILPFDMMGLIFNSSSFGSLKILRIIRLLRLIKLVRVFRASRVFKRFELSMDTSYSTISLIKFLVLVAIAVHWIACAWHLGPVVSGTAPNWIDSFGFVDMGPGERYLTCVYFAVIALPVGVGDIVPTTTSERIIAVGCMAFGGSIYAYVIGAICGVLATRDPATTEFHQTMDHLNAFMEEINLPQPKRAAIREYFHFCRSLFRSQYYNEILQQMSPKLRGDIALHCHQSWICEIPFFRCPDLEERTTFVTAVALSLKLEAYAPKELIIKNGEFTEKMYIIQKGLVARLGRVLGAGRFFGEDVILHNSRRQYFVRVLTFLDVYSFSKTDLEDILENGDFPETRKLIRRSAIRLALTREFCRIADQVRMGKLLGRKVSLAGPGVGLSDVASVTSGVGGTVLDRKEAVRKHSLALSVAGSLNQQDDAPRTGRRSVMSARSDHEGEEKTNAQKYAELTQTLQQRIVTLEAKMSLIVSQISTGVETLNKLQSDNRTRTRPRLPAPSTGAPGVGAPAGSTPAPNPPQSDSESKNERP